MKAKELAELLLKTPDAEVTIYVASLDEHYGVVGVNDQTESSVELDYGGRGLK